MDMPARGTQPVRHEPDLVPLMASIAHGDQAALSELYRRTSRKLYGICVGTLGSESDAEEVLQDVYVTIWRKAALFDRTKSRPITWLAVLARNRSIDRLRRKRLPTGSLELAADVPDGSDTALEVIELAEDSARLSACLEELDEQQKGFIKSAFIEGATYSQLADRASVPLGTMKSWIRRGLQRLRGCLGE
jgi:RNA polymerase sigma factor (sigma-70 family)